MFLVDMLENIEMMSSSSPTQLASLRDMGIYEPFQQMVSWRNVFKSDINDHSPNTASSSVIQVDHNIIKVNICILVSRFILVWTLKYCYLYVFLLMVWVVCRRVTLLLLITRSKQNLLVMIIRRRMMMAGIMIRFVKNIIKNPFK